MQANDLLESRNEIIKAFKNGTFLSEHLKKSGDAAYNYMLKNANELIEEIKSMVEKINLSLFEEFFEHSSPADYAKMLIDTKNADENNKNVKDIENRISHLKDKKVIKKKKMKMRMKHQRLLKKLLIMIKMLKILFIVPQKLIKRKSKPKAKKSIAERIKLRRQKLNIIAEKKRKNKQYIVQLLL